jgi:hypothetical protein
MARAATTKPSAAKPKPAGANAATRRPPATRAAAAKLAAPKPKTTLPKPSPTPAPARTAKADKPLPRKSTPTTVKVAPPPPPPPPPEPARFSFTAVPLVRDAAGLTPLLREQLVVDTRVRTGRVTTPDRIPTTYFSPGVVRWRVSEKKKPVLDVVHDTAFFPDTAEPMGLERIAGHWQATGRSSERARALDLPRLAWELTRDWPGRRVPLGPEPKPGARWKPQPPPPGDAWPADTVFV